MFRQPVTSPEQLHLRSNRDANIYILRTELT
jgi:hypothetical protein